MGVTNDRLVLQMLIGTASALIERATPFAEMPAVCSTTDHGSAGGDELCSRLTGVGDLCRRLVDEAGDLRALAVVLLNGQAEEVRVS